MNIAKKIIFLIIMFASTIQVFYAANNSANLKKEIKTNIPITNKNIKNRLENIAFHRLLNGGAVLSIDWDTDKSDVKIISLKNNSIQIKVENAVIAKDWLSKIDTTIFKTIVKSINIEKQNNSVIFILKANTDISFKKETTTKFLKIFINKKIKNIDNFDSKKLITLNFENSPIRVLLHTMAKFSNLNLVISDQVKGNISLNVNNVSWQSVMNMIMMSKGLAEKRVDGMLYVAPSSEIAKQDKEEENLLNIEKKLSPLKIAFIKLNYANATSLAKIIKSDAAGVLSKKGSITIDSRTNTIIISDTQSNINKVKILIKHLDAPVDQVLIEARIVEVTRGSAFNLGVNYNLKGDSLSGGFNPAATTANSTGFSLSYSHLLGGINLDMEINALESENKAELVSSPRLLISDNTKAYIKQGSDVPYLESAESGAASVAFKEAVLELNVTPQIAPNGDVVLDVLLKKDAVSKATVGDEPILDRREISTKLIVKSGSTVVLGGIYETDKQRKKTKIPLLGDIPLLGWLFSNTSTESNSRELLIFITPKIIEHA